VRHYSNLYAPHYIARRNDMLKGYRTYIMAGLGILSAVASYLVGDVDAMTAANAAFTAAAVAFLRSSVPQHPT
jgi:hypothetical protein